MMVRAVPDLGCLKVVATPAHMSTDEILSNTSAFDGKRLLKERIEEEKMRKKGLTTAAT
jgi:hypothetical protein